MDVLWDGWRFYIKSEHLKNFNECYSTFNTLSFSVTIKHSFCPLIFQMHLYVLCPHVCREQRSEKLLHGIVNFESQKRHFVLFLPVAGIVFTPVDTVCCSSSSRMNCTDSTVRENIFCIKIHIRYSLNYAILMTTFVCKHISPTKL